MEPPPQTGSQHPTDGRVDHGQHQRQTQQQLPRGWAVHFSPADYWQQGNCRRQLTDDMLKLLSNPGGPALIASSTYYSAASAQIICVLDYAALVASGLPNIKDAVLLDPLTALACLSIAATQVCAVLERSSFHLIAAVTTKLMLAQHTSTYAALAGCANRGYTAAAGSTCCGHLRCAWDCDCQAD
jgi:hypothetical protein